MTDLKKILMDLSEDIKYSDMYDLTSAPKILRDAANKIGELELDIIKLLSRLEESRLNQSSENCEVITSASTIQIIPYLPPRLDRSRIKSDLDDLGVEYSAKDNTQRLLSLLEKARKG